MGYLVPGGLRGLGSGSRTTPGTRLDEWTKVDTAVIHVVDTDWYIVGEGARRDVNSRESVVCRTRH